MRFASWDVASAVVFSAILRTPIVIPTLHLHRSPLILSPLSLHMQCMSCAGRMVVSKEASRQRTRVVVGNLMRMHCISLKQCERLA